MMALPLTVVLGSVAPAAAVILVIVLELLTLFSVVGLTFATHADVRAVAEPPADVESCDIVISILDEHGQVLDSVQARVPSGGMVTLQYRSRSGPGSTDAIRATVRSRTVFRRSLPPGPCPILASLQVVDESTGKTEAMMMPAQQRTVREVITAP
jgi:hypothetical protein